LPQKLLATGIVSDFYESDIRLDIHERETEGGSDAAAAPPIGVLLLSEG
jgi:hypothetical protein